MAWSGVTATTITVFIKAPVDWSDGAHYIVGEIRLPRCIFRWPKSDRIFMLVEGWTAEQRGDALFLFPLSLGQGDDGYQEFVLPLSVVEKCHVIHDTTFVMAPEKDGAIPVPIISE